MIRGQSRTELDGAVLGPRLRPALLRRRARRSPARGEPGDRTSISRRAGAAARAAARRAWSLVFSTDDPRYGGPGASGACGPTGGCSPGKRRALTSTPSAREARRSTASRSRGRDATPASSASREWLVTNGLGGYASGTLLGATRRYHGLFVPNLARAARAHDDGAAPRRRADRRRRRRASRRRRSHGRDDARATSRGASASSGSTGRSRPGRFEVGGAHASRSDRRCPSGRTRPTCIHAALRRAVPAAPAAVLHLPHARRAARRRPRMAVHASRSSAADATRSKPVRGRAVAALLPAPARGRLRGDERHVGVRVFTSRGGRAATTTTRTCHPRLLRPRPASPASRAVAFSTEPWELLGSDGRGGDRRGAAAPAEAAARWRRSARGGLPRAQLVLAADQFVVLPGSRLRGERAARASPATRCAPSSPAITGSPTGAATR